MRDPAELFAELSKSKFRSRFHLPEAEREYLDRRGPGVIVRHAFQFVETRLAPALPAKDGKQTPWRGHPVFIAQHATATCCRTCLEKWHRIPKGRELSAEERRYAVNIIRQWLDAEMQLPGRAPRPKAEMQELFDCDNLESMADDR